MRVTHRQCGRGSTFRLFFMSFEPSSGIWFRCRLLSWRSRHIDRIHVKGKTYRMTVPKHVFWHRRYIGLRIYYGTFVQCCRLCLTGIMSRQRPCKWSAAAKRCVPNSSNEAHWLVHDTIHISTWKQTPSPLEFKNRSVVLFVKKQSVALLFLNIISKCPDLKMKNSLKALFYVPFEIIFYLDIRCFLSITKGTFFF